ncbi:Protein-tyrosine-phosphatase [Eubacterium aggregans]|uniref:protein-tyrosine-phosphatase n=1 Tax=Eubacterium aggregans TaxID=81409 RepID=A0A1H4EG60_9FIRM|nr:Protein-tyrosine-phosphatase [Eubacterium aggregans]
MIKILFVCHGNICRSPMAEFVLKDMVNRLGMSDRVSIQSAATSSEEIWNGVGNPVYPPAREVLEKHGIECQGKRAVQLRASDYDTADYLIGMDEANIRNMEGITGHTGGKIYKLLFFAGRDASISDPWYSGRFDETYEDIVKGCRAFLDKLQAVLADLDRLEEKDNTTAYKALQTLEQLSDESGMLYPFTERFAAMVQEQRTYLRVRGFRLLCKQAKWDQDGLLDKYLPSALSILWDEKPTVVRQALGALKDVVSYQPKLREMVVQAIADIDDTPYPETMQPLIAKDVKALLEQIQGQ